jgi:hypothetical protein
MSTLPQVAKPAKGGIQKPRGKGVRIDENVLFRMNQEQIRIYGLTGKKPSIIDLNVHAWEAYERERDRKQARMAKS